MEKFRDIIIESVLSKKDGDYLNIYTNEIVKIFKANGITVDKSDIMVEDDSIVFSISPDTLDGSSLNKSIKKITKTIKKDKNVDSVQFDNNKYFITIYFDDDNIELY